MFGYGRPRTCRDEDGPVGLGLSMANMKPWPAVGSFLPSRNDCPRSLSLSLPSRGRGVRGQHPGWSRKSSNKGVDRRKEKCRYSKERTSSSFRRVDLDGLAIIDGGNEGRLHVGQLPQDCTTMALVYQKVALLNVFTADFQLAINCKAKHGSPRAVFIYDYLRT